LRMIAICIGAVSVGILVHSGGVDESSTLQGEEGAPPMPVQGPACNGPIIWLGGIPLIRCHMLAKVQFT